jgi:hypothetical protein
VAPGNGLHPLFVRNLQTRAGNFCDLRVANAAALCPCGARLYAFRFTDPATSDVQNPVWYELI